MPNLYQVSTLLVSRLLRRLGKTQPFPEEIPVAMGAVVPVVVLDTERVYVKSGGTVDVSAGEKTIYTVPQGRIGHVTMIVKGLTVTANGIRWNSAPGGPSAEISIMLDQTPRYYGFFPMGQIDMGPGEFLAMGQGGVGDVSISWFVFVTEEQY